jgi:glycine/D-amino acid oxidase-like deaminating enzyme
MQTTPYWWDDAWPIPIRPAPLPANADVIVVGSGYTGLSAALTLLKAGRSVVIVEMGRVAQGASSRNGGMCGDQLKPSFAELRARFGVPLATRLCGEARDALVHFQEFLAENRIRCDFVKSGRLTGALSDVQLAGLIRASETLKRHTGIEFELVEKRDLHGELGTDAYVGARLCPHHGGLHPAKYASELVRCVIEAGGVIRESTAYQSCETVSGGLSVTTSAGTIRARDLVVATNGYSEGSGRSLRRRLIPVTSYMIATDELPATLMDELMPRRRMVTDTNRLLCYYRPSPDGKRILFGGRPAYTEISPQASAQRLMAYLRTLFPALRGVGVSHSWFGMIAYTIDRLPHIGQMNGFHYAGGYCGSGVVMATWLGNKLGRRILGAKGGESAFAEIVHPTHPLYYGRPWFLPIVQAWYRGADLWERRVRVARRS